jgi:ketosteroid isomerase-like protein
VSAPTAGHPEREADPRAAIDSIRSSNREVVEAFFDPDRRDRRLELFADDGVKEIPFAPPAIEPRTWRGREELERNAAENAERFGDIAHVDVRISSGDDPSEFWATSRLAAGATIFGRPYPQEFVHYFRLREGKIVLWREYFNSSVLADAIDAARERA